MTSIFIVVYNFPLEVTANARITSVIWKQKSRSGWQFGKTEPGIDIR